MANTNLHNAKDAQDAEFYTQLIDIQEELKYYTNHFKGKTVFCNCDDPFESNFTLYFLMHFNRLGLKRLISTGYATSPIAGRKIKQNGTYCLDVSDTKHALKENQKDLNASDALNMIIAEKNLTKILKGEKDYLAGDFRSKESLALLEQCDIVVSNPPFYLFREYIAMLEKYKKKYLFIGDINQTTYKEFFPLIKEGMVWMGATMNGTGSHWFEVPPTYQNKNVKIINGVRMMTNGRACWWTNLDYAERHKIIPLGYRYIGYENNYPKYDNYNAIDIGYSTKTGSRRGDIFRTPYDYEGIMGVPSTSLGKLCPEQFEIVGLAPERLSENDAHLQIKRYKNAVQHKKDGTTCSGNKVNDGPVLVHNSKPLKYPYYTSETVPDKYLQVLFARILVRNRQPNRTDWENWQKEIDNARKGK